MTTETINSGELFASLDASWNELTEMIASVDEETMDKVPHKDSWTPAQLATHVTKSNNAIADGMGMDGKPAERDAEEGVPNLKKMFLDFDAKYESPDFIIPEKKEYHKNEVVKALQGSIDKLKEARNKVNLIEIIALPIFGEITKLELLYFVLYHTQRHIHQLKRILKTLKQAS